MKPPYSVLAQKLFQLLLLVTPLIMFHKTSELFEFNKMIFIYLITSLLSITWLLNVLADKKIIIKKTFFMIPFLLFLLSQSVSLLFSIDKHTSWFGYYGRFNGGLLSIISYLSLFFMAVFFFAPAKNGDSVYRAKLIERFLKTSIVSSFIVILWGLPGRFGYDLSCLIFTGQLNNNCWTSQFRPAERMFSTLGQPNWLAAYLACNFLFAGYFFFKNRFLSRNFFIVAGYMALNMAAILFTRSRSAGLAVMTGLFVLLFYLLKTQREQYRRHFLILFIILVIPVIFLKTGVNSIDRYLNKPSFTGSAKIAKPKNPVSIKLQNNNVTESGDIRKIVWRGAVELSYRFPFFGTGIETFAYAYYFVRPKDHNLTSEWDFIYNKAHNEYLNYVATTGYFGLIAYLGVIVSVFYFVIKKSNNQDDLLTIALLSAYITILVSNFFGFSTTTVNLFFYLIPAFLVIHNESSGQTVIKLSEKKSFLVMSKIFTAFFAIGSIWFVISYFIADVRYAQAESNIKNSDYSRAYENLKSALFFKQEHVYQDRLSNVLANIAFLSAFQDDADAEALSRRVADSYNLSNYYNEQSIRQSPKNVLYYKTRAKNYYVFYQITEQKPLFNTAIRALKAAEAIAPTDPKIPFTTALFYSMYLDNNGKAKDAGDSIKIIRRNFDSAIALKPDYLDAYIEKAGFLKKIGDVGGARSVLSQGLNYLPGNSQLEETLKAL